MRKTMRRYRTLASYGYRSDPRRFLLSALCLVLTRTLPLVAALLARLVIVKMVEDDFDMATVYAVGVGLVAALSFIATRGSTRLMIALIERTTELYDRDLIRLSGEVATIEHFENPEFLDQLEQIRYQPQALGQNGVVVALPFATLLETTLVVVLLLRVHPALLLLPVFSAVSVWATRKAQSIQQRAFADGSPHRRVADHFYDVATSSARADEVRTLRIGHELIERHERDWFAADAVLGAAERRGALITTAGTLVSTAAYAGAVAFVVTRGIRGDASAGDVVLTVILAGIISTQLNSLRDLGMRLLSAMRMVDRFIWLIDYAAAHAPPADPASVPSRIAEGIRLDHVTFSYPGTGRPVLDGLTLDLPAGATVAVVGENGAGKTTLVKLLTGMYAPTSGRITIDGVDLGTFDVAEWRARTSAAFQDFARFELPLQQSIGIGDLPHVDDAGAVMAALERAGGTDLLTHVDRGLQANLGSSYPDGIELSGGQWQRVALGRTMMRPAPLLLILDEPTSNLDAVVEHELFARYAAHARQAAIDTGAITLLVSHRFSTVRFADLILVLAGGVVAEAGTHAELMRHGGLYAELFELQASAYRDSPSPRQDH